MAAPSSTVWGDIVNGNTSGRKGKLGIYVNVSNTNTQTTVNVQVWFWTIYSCVDGYNTLYYNAGTSVTSATTSVGSIDINHTVATGTGWNTSNQTKLLDKTYTYTRGTSATTYKVYAKFADVDMLPAGLYANTSYTVPKLATYTISYNANGGSGAPSSQTKYYGINLTLSSTKPTRTGYSFQGWALTNGGSVYYSAGSTCGKNENLTLYAVWKANTYIVSYNANGGSGAPSSQTKTYGVTLTLSGTKPTRTGYSFQGWATSSSGSVAYASGASYTANSAVTLYAVWKANTYIVSYNANGGSGAPSSQTKTYGVTLTLSGTKPTRANYNFLGWATSASATTATYAAGGKYTANSGVTLYAVWSLAYTKPRITDISVERCDSNGALTDNGTYVHVYFKWECDRVIQNATVEWKTATGETGSINPFPWDDQNQTASYFDLLIGEDTVFDLVTGMGLDATGQLFSTDSTYTFIITVTDTLGYNTAITTVNGMTYTIDLFAGGTGLAFGKPAELDGVMDIRFQTRMFGGIMHPYLEPETNLDDIRTPNTYIGADISTYNYTSQDADGNENFPLKSGTFSLEVIGMGDAGQVKQRLTYCHKTVLRAWERIYYQSAWGDWRLVCGTKDIAFTPVDGITITRYSISRQENMVTAFLCLKYASAVTAGTSVQIGNIPTEDAPSDSVATIGISGTSGTAACWIRDDGTVMYRPNVAHTAGNAIEFNLTWNVSATWHTS